jgi:hypothetical protein
VSVLAASDTLVDPAYLWVPPHVSSAGDEAADLAESAGLVLDAEQRLILNTVLSVRAGGKWAALAAAVIEARQNGKSASLIAVVLADLFLFGTRLSVWSAHEVNTSLEAFRDLKQLIEGAPHLSQHVKAIHEANGKEAVELRSGQRLMFKARTRTGARGLSGDRVILDEAWALTATMMGAVMPIMSAKTVTGNPQMVLASSAGLASSAILRTFRDRGRPGGDPSLAYIEWCAPVVPCADDWCDHLASARGCALDDVDAWRRANPALERPGRVGRITLDYVRAERALMPPEEFARERLGWWDEPVSSQGGVPAEVWEACARPGGVVGDVRAIAVDVTPEFSHSSVAVAGAGGVELVAHERGWSWVPALVAALATNAVPVIVDVRGPASVVEQALSDVGLSLTRPSGQDMAQASAGFVDGLVGRTLWHGSQYDLDVAVRGAKRVESGDSFRWSRKSSSVDISPLVAVTLARWGAEQGPTAPPQTGLLNLNDFLDDGWDADD